MTSTPEVLPKHFCRSEYGDGRYNCDDVKEYAEDYAREYARLNRRAGVPEGFVLVPREPTEAMIDALATANGGRVFDAHARAFYLAALAAAPQPPVASVDVEQMLRDCVPGGSIVDPQLVCDNIRDWWTRAKSPVAQPDRWIDAAPTAADAKP